MSSLLAIRERDQGEIGAAQIAKLSVLIINIRVVELIWQMLDVEIFVKVWNVKHGVLFS